MAGIKIKIKDKGEIEFGVMSLPNRKSKALYKTRGAMIEILAYFCSDDCADEFQKAIDFMIDNMPQRRGE